jgi:predicted cupin superfamily sugar epimerase
VSAGERIRELSLVPHPEGGHYREVHRSDHLTVIWFLLREGEESAWHRLESEEVWTRIDGAPVELSLVPPDVSRREARLVDGLAVVPPGWWQAARGGSPWSLVTCAVAPPFRFEAFRLLRDDPEAAARFRAAGLA